MTPARAGDLRKDSSIQTCDQVLRSIATLHATFWESPRLDDVRWLNGLAINPRMRHRLYLGARAKFVEHHQTHLTAEDLAVLEWIDRNGPSLSRIFDRDAPPTVIHCDLRFDNVMFDTRNQPIAFIDWQLAAIGPAAFDVAYFLSAALDTSVSRRRISRSCTPITSLALDVREQFPFEQLLPTTGAACSPVSRCSALLLLDSGGLEMDDSTLGRARFGRLRGTTLVDLLSPCCSAALAHGTQRSMVESQSSEPETEQRVAVRATARQALRLVTAVDGSPSR